MTTKTAPTGYKSHNAGSRKGEVHRIFDTKGPEAAEKWGIAQGLKSGTLKSWFGVWKRDAKSAPEGKADKPAPKATEKKAKPAAKKTGKPKGAKVEKKTDNGRQTVTKIDAITETKPTPRTDRP